MTKSEFELKLKKVNNWKVFVFALCIAAPFLVGQYLYSDQSTFTYSQVYGQILISMCLGISYVIWYITRLIRIMLVDED